MDQNSINKKRRNFLKLMAFGGGSILLGKVLGPTFSKLLEGSSNSLAQGSSQNFRAVEGKHGLVIYDQAGEEIFTMDNGR